MEKDTMSDPLAYLKGRGISEATRAALGIKVATSEGPARVAFPYADAAGKVQAHKVRPIAEKTFWWKPKGVGGDLFNIAALFEPEWADLPIVITEGEIDAASCVEAGYARTVGLPDGWDANDSKIGKLQPYIEQFRNSPKIVVAGDTDEAGRGLARAMFNLLDTHPVSVCSWPEGCKDPNDVLQQHGVKVLVECLNGARPLNAEGAIITGLHDMPVMPPRVIYTSGHPMLDEVFRLELGTVNVVTGIPGHGKSTWATWALDQCAGHNRVKVGAVMFETHPYQLRDHLCRMETGNPYRFDDPRCVAASEATSRRWQVVHPQEDDNVPFDMVWLREVIRDLSVHHACKIVLVDPWNEIEHSVSAKQSETQYTSDALGSLRKWARRFDVAVVVVAHPRKMDQTSDRPVMGYDINGSANWYNKTFMGWTVQRTDNDDGSTFSTIYAWKVKDQFAYGIKPSSIDLEMNTQSMSFGAVSESYGALSEARQ